MKLIFYVIIITKLHVYNTRNYVMAVLTRLQGKVCDKVQYIVPRRRICQRLGSWRYQWSCRSRNRSWCTPCRTPHARRAATPGPGSAPQRKQPRRAPTGPLLFNMQTTCDTLMRITKLKIFPVPARLHSGSGKLIFRRYLTTFLDI